MLKVIPKSASNWKAYDRAIVGVSLGSRNHIGPAFAGLMNWVGQNFETCIIDLSDSLHRYNLIQEGYNPEEAHSLAQIQGAQWLHDHNTIIEKMPVPTTVIRWDHWLSHPDFLYHLNAFKAAAETQPDFLAALIRDVQRFISRRNILLQSMSSSYLQHSVHYLLEELAAHSLLYAPNSGAVIYPGKDHESFQMAREGKIKNVPSGHRNTIFTRMVIYNFDTQKLPASTAYAALQDRAA